MRHSPAVADFFFLACGLNMKEDAFSQGIRMVDAGPQVERPILS